MDNYTQLFVQFGYLVSIIVYLLQNKNKYTMFSRRYIFIFGLKVAYCMYIAIFCRKFHILNTVLVKGEIFFKSFLAMVASGISLGGPKKG